MANVNKTEISMSRGRLFIRPHFERQIPVLRRAEDMAWCTMGYFLEAKILEHSD
jgi:hypothetical protein